MPAKPRGTPFKKGRAKTGGRKPGVGNRTPVAVKEFFRRLVENPDVQDAFESQIVAGDRGSMAAYLGAAAHVIGKPKETVQVDTTPNMAKLLTMSITKAQERAKQAKEKSQ